MEPITRREMYLAAAAGYDVDPPEPITREEVFLAKLAGMDVETPVPYTRRERFIEEAAVAANKAVIEPLTITENGTYTAPAGVDGYNPVTVNVDPTKVTILKEQTISGFDLIQDLGYIKEVSPPPFTLVNGEKYYVVWNGVTYETTAIDASALGEGALYLGNGTIFGLPGNNEPFAIGYAENDVVLYIALEGDLEEYTVGIWQSLVQEIKLQDKTITENGEYTADSGFDGLGKVTVEVAGSGGLIEPIVTNGTFIPSDTTYTFNHNLGVVPDCIMVYNTNANTGTAGQSTTLYAIGFRAGLHFGKGIQDILAYTANGAQIMTTTSGIDATSSTVAGFCKADSTKVTVGGILAKMDTDATYEWRAVRITAY